MAESYQTRRHRLQQQYLQADGRFRQAQSERSMSMFRDRLKATTLSSRIDRTSSASRREHWNDVLERIRSTKAETVAVIDRCPFPTSPFPKEKLRDRVEAIDVTSRGAKAALTELRREVGQYRVSFDQPAEPLEDNRGYISAAARFRLMSRFSGDGSKPIGLPETRRLVVTTDLRLIEMCLSTLIELSDEWRDA